MSTQVNLAELLAQRAYAHSFALPAKLAVRSEQQETQHSLHRGRGMEFSEFRIYQPGDDVRTIDWRATARSGKTQVRIYREERSRPFYFLIDQSQSMQFGTRIAFKAVLAARAAALLAWAACADHYQVGGIIAGHTTPFFSALRSAQRGVLSLFDLILRAQRSESTAPNLEPALQYLLKKTKSGSSVAIFSDFYDFSENTQRLLKQLARYYELRLFYMIDPLENHLPSQGRYTLSNGLEDWEFWGDDRKLQQAYHEQIKKKQKALYLFSRKTQLKMAILHSDQNLLEQLRRATHA